MRRASVALGVIWLSAVVCGAAGQTSAPTSTKDKVYTKEQASRGETLYEANCAKCHEFDGPRTDKGPPLGGDEFFKKWEGKSVFELAVGIRLKMPPDGSVILDEAQTADVVAYMLKSEGFAAGDKALKTDASTKTLLFVKPK